MISKDWIFITGVTSKNTQLLIINSLHFQSWCWCRNIMV